MKLITVLENLREDNQMSIYKKTDELFKIAYDYSVYDLLDVIVTNEDIEVIIEEYVNSGSSWERIAIFLSGVKVLNQQYYHLNGYGNLENLTSEKFYILLDDFIDEVKYKGLENEEVNYNE